MKKALALLVSSAVLLPPTAFAEDAARTLRDALGIRVDSGRAPGFFSRRISAKCGDFVVNGLSATGSTQGHSVTLNVDTVNHLVEYTIDDARWTAFLDANGQIVQIRDPLNKIHGHTPLSQSAAAQAATAHRSEFLEMVQNCEVPSSTKCLEDHQFSDGVKSCTPDYYGDEGYWEDELAPGYDVSEWTDNVSQDQQVCQAQKQACGDACNANAQMDAALCAALINPYAVAACAAGSAALWARCTNKCSTSFPC